MIKVIKEGKPLFKIKCPYCEALLEYNNRDVITEITSFGDCYQVSHHTYITCPECNHKIILKASR